MSDRKIVLVHGGYTRKRVREIMDRVKYSLTEAGLDVKTHYGKLYIQTKNVHVIFTTHYSNVQHIKASEVFGFTDDEAQKLRKSGKAENYNGSLIDYIIRAEQ